MADDTKIEFGQSREQVAYRLMQDIFSVEGVNLYDKGSTNRDTILQTYRQCWEVVVGIRPKT